MAWREVASRVVGASTHQTTRRGRLKYASPQRVRQPILPRRLSLRPAAASARPPPPRLSPAHALAVPPGLATSGNRGAAGLRPFHRAPLDPPLQHPRGRRTPGSAAGRPATAGGPP